MAEKSRSRVGKDEVWQSGAGKEIWRRRKAKYALKRRPAQMGKRKQRVIKEASASGRWTCVLNFLSFVSGDLYV